MNENFEAWQQADETKKYYALRLALAYIAGDAVEVDRYADQFREADAEMDRLDEALGEQ